MAEPKRKGWKTREFIESRWNITRDNIQPVTATGFLKIWTKYDQDANRYLEREEISRFLRDFINSEASSLAQAAEHGRSVTSANKARTISESDLRELTQIFMEEFDQDRDGKISIRELTQILPVEECFRVVLDHEMDAASGLDYVKIWQKYDVDGSGHLEMEELKLFLHDLITKNHPERQMDPKKLTELAKIVMTLYDTNGDGRLGLSEVVRLLPSRENSVQLVLDKARQLQRLTQSDINKILERYDQDHNGTLDGEELENLLVDLLDAMQGDKSYSTHDLKELKRAVLKGCDMDGDGKICKKELAVILLAVVQSGLSALYGGIGDPVRSAVMNKKPAQKK
ncbi:calbindin-32-like [Paramacrobiotus metropolitanus]|uniref:calbindin-32-like n=1 Tax=Paramacrobiotus metropolitanus TaxID=2943436 RepID=UPI00244657A9|nr:calbindin-32-like [Paramacrobiotus metropolitanus]